FWPLARVPGVRVRYVDRGAGLGRPDLVILPGTKTTIRDLDWLRQVGLADRIVQLAKDEPGPVILGLCGGFQMLGARIDDPAGVESASASVEGLALLDVTTRFVATKARHRVSGAVRDGAWPIAGYEL